MALKYGSYVDLISNCPPTVAAEQNRPGWRYVFVPIKGDSFVPLALLNSAPPSSAKSGANGKVRKHSCSAWGLSMYDTADQALSRFTEVLTTSPNIKARVGTHLAFGELTAECGVSTPSNPIGHFDLHPYDGIALEDIFSVSNELP